MTLPDLTPQPSLPPNTTHQQDVVTTRQSQINFIWEVTQAVIAVVITLAVIYLAITQTVSEVITNAFFLIIGFYYSRTNHQAIGGVGPKANEGQTYEGR